MSKSTLAIYCGAALLVHLLVIAPSFEALPAGDDWGPPLSEIHRGRDRGVGDLLTTSLQPNYRPLSSVAMYLTGPYDAGVWARIRWLHVGCWATLLVAAAVWTRLARLGQVATAVTLAVVTVHPVLAAMVGSVDGFGSTVAPALMWLGAAAVVRWNHRLWLGLPLALAALLVGLGFKEYVLGMIALAPLAVLLLTRERPWVKAVVCGAALLAVGLVWMTVRTWAIPGGRGYGAAPDAMLWARNLGLFAAALSFLGDSCWAFLRRDAVAGVSMAAGGAIWLTLWAAGGVGRWRSRGVAVPQPSSVLTDTSWRWLGFAVLALPAAGMPALLLSRVSEMYAAGPLLALALLTGWLAQGWAAWPPRVRAVCVVIALGAGVWAGVSQRQKVERVVRVGARAGVMVQALVDALPAEARPLTVVLGFSGTEHAGQASYSVFEIPDAELLNSTGGPYMGTAGTLADPRLAQLVIVLGSQGQMAGLGGEAEVAMWWDASAGRFVPVR